MLEISLKIIFVRLKTSFIIKLLLTRGGNCSSREQNAVCEYAFRLETLAKELFQ